MLEKNIRSSLISPLKIASRWAKAFSLLEPPSEETTNDKQREILHFLYIIGLVPESGGGTS